MLTEPDLQFARRRMDELFPGGRLEHLLWQLHHYACTLQSFDVTFFEREPLLEVKLSESFARDFLAATAAPHLLRPICREITFSDGSKARIDEIWTLNYMPEDGIGIAELAAVNLAEAELHAGDQGETIREMIRATYHCASPAEEDYFVRRWIAS